MEGERLLRVRLLPEELRNRPWGPSAGFMTPEAYRVFKVLPTGRIVRAGEPSHTESASFEVDAYRLGNQAEELRNFIMLFQRQDYKVRGEYEPIFKLAAAHLHDNDGQGFWCLQEAMTRPMIRKALEAGRMSGNPKPSKITDAAAVVILRSSETSLILYVRQEQGAHNQYLARGTYKAAVPVGLDHKEVRGLEAVILLAKDEVVYVTYQVGQNQVEKGLTFDGRKLAWFQV